MNEAAQSLVGVDPDDTDVFEFGGARFVLGVMPAGKWSIIQSRQMVVQQEAMRRMIPVLNAKGIAPDAVVSTTEMSDGTKIELTQVDIAAAQDSEHIEQLMQIRIDALKLSLRSMTGFKNRHGTEFKLEFEFGFPTDASMRVFGVNRGLLDALWIRIRELNSLGTLAKKA